MDEGTDRLASIAKRLRKLALITPELDKLADELEQERAWISRRLATIEAALDQAGRNLKNMSDSL